MGVSTERINERSFVGLSVRHQLVIPATGMHISTPTSHSVCRTLGALVLQQRDDGMSARTRDTQHGTGEIGQPSPESGK